MSNSTDSQSRELRSISLIMNADQVEDIILVHCVMLWQLVVSQNVVLSTLYKLRTCYFYAYRTFQCVKMEVQIVGKVHAIRI